MPRIHLAAFAAVLMTALVATPASALYIQTPLLLEGADHADVGDNVTLTVRPFNATEAAKFAGAPIRVIYAYDANEPGSDAAPTLQERFVRDIVLGDDATVSFVWTVPAEVQDRNVDVILVQGDERLAFHGIAIGDAEPQMHILAFQNGPADEGAEPAEKAAKDVPAVGAFAAVAALGAAMVLRRK